MIHSVTLANLSPRRNSNQQAPDATSFFHVEQDAYREAAWPERLLSEKSGRCGIAAD